MDPSKPRWYRGRKPLPVQPGQTSNRLSNLSQIEREFQSPPSPPPQTERERSPPRHIIPGPAGEAQLAMRRHHTGKAHVSQGPPAQSTQEAIRRKLEEPEDDDEFQGKAWLSAMDYLTGEGTFYPLKMIKEKCKQHERVEQVVVVVKKCTPTENGSFHVILKDPTDTIEAYLGDKVFKQTEGGSDIGEGAVLILTQVVVWAISRSKKLLNIVPSNVCKVFPKDC